MRLDKWLWAARFYKTRGLAADAVESVKVRLNGVAAKPAKEVKAGDRLELRIGDQNWEVVVQGVSDRRGPAAEARLLYQETPESAERRMRLAELRRLAPTPGADQKGRPTKRDRRQISRIKDG